MLSHFRGQPDRVSFDRILATTALLGCTGPTYIMWVSNLQQEQELLTVRHDLTKKILARETSVTFNDIQLSFISLPYQTDKTFTTW